MDVVLKPAMAILSLPPAAALPILVGILSGVYGCIAAMAVLPLAVDHMTIITVFVLIAHSLPQEGIIQAKSGINFVKTTMARLAAAIATCLVVAVCIGPDDGGAAATASNLREIPSFWPFLQTWLIEMLRLCIKILAILFGVMITIELMKEFNLIDLLVRLFGPVLKMMGLDRRAGVLWLTGVLFGLSYGGAVIVEQSRELHLSPKEVEKLQLSIGINHSMIEDPLLFLPFGIHPVWLLVPRLAAAILAVYCVDLSFWLRKTFKAS
jgi:spore maturation protein SpmB